MLAPALKRIRGSKRRYNSLEDNDPTGFKAQVSKDTKAELKIQPIEFPTYSPDINPLDYALWTEVERRMSKQVPPRIESMADFKCRLRRTAMNIPKAVICKMLRGMKRRMQSIYDAGGGHIARD